MKLILLCLCLLWGLALPTSSFAHITHQQDTIPATRLNSPFNGEYYNAETGVHIYLDLDEETLEVPTMEFLGPMHGYMKGGIYGVWMLIKHEVKNGKAVLRFSNDIGSDSQTIELTPLGKGTYRYQAVGENLVRKVVGRRLVKITDTMIMTKVETP